MMIKNKLHAFQTYSDVFKTSGEWASDVVTNIMDAFCNNNKVQSS